MLSSAQSKTNSDLSAIAVAALVNSRIKSQNTTALSAKHCTLKAGGTYLIAVMKNIADLTLTTAAYLGFGGAATSSTMLLTSDHGFIYVAPLADTDLYILWVTAACPVQVIGCNAAALVA
jgi:hypothetical protein